MSKKKPARKRVLKKIMKGNIVLPLLFVIIGFGILLTSGALVNKSSVDTTEQFGDAEVASSSGKSNLQLKDISFKPKPTPEAACTADSGNEIPDACVCPDAHVVCEGGKCKEIIKDKSGGGFQNYTCAQWDQYGWCKPPYAPHDGHFCIGKPVIYLYPTSDTLVDVSVITEGKVVISDPQIESFGGWKNVLAHPDGTLFYKNATYRELFYETDTTKVTRPNAGIIIEKENLRSKLLAFVTQLGLTRQDEQEEFLDWWIPRLNSISTDKLFVSVLERDEKERLDQVVITPKPDTFIDFIVYFAPLEDHQTVTPLVIPPTPQRKGFTAIEWGGVIAK